MLFSFSARNHMYDTGSTKINEMTQNQAKNNEPKLFYPSERFSFKDDPKDIITEHRPMIYTIWDKDGNFIYVGVCGIGKEHPMGRIKHHRSGNRGGDKFCVYAQDYYVIPKLLKGGLYLRKRKYLDDIIGCYVRDNLFYRFVFKDTKDEVFSLEKKMKKGCPEFPTPLLNGPDPSWGLTDNST